MRRSRSVVSSSAAAVALLATAVAQAQQLSEPGEGQLVTSFSGSGSVPFSYSASSRTSSIDVAVSLEDPNGGNTSFPLANGLLGESGDYNAVFAPSGGWCGAVTLEVYENGSSSNSSGPTVTRPFVVSCGPIQLALPPSDRVKRQEGGGPSGSLTSPSGGSTVQPDGSIDIVYAPVTEGGQTFAIDAVLSSEAANYTLVNGLWKANDTDNISGSFAAPADACGNFSLVITEHQIYQNGAIAFQAAAPALTIDCSANSTNSTNGTSAGPSVTLLPTANITLPVSSVTQTTTVVSTFTTTLSSGSITQPFTTTISTILSPPASSTGTNSTAVVVPGSTTSGESTSSQATTSTTSTSTSESNSRVPISTRTVTAAPESVPSIITTTVPAPTSVTQESRTMQPVTSTVTRTQVVVIESPGQSRVTSTQRQTVLIVSQSIAAIVQPSSSAAPSMQQPSGAGYLAASPNNVLSTTLACLLAGAFVLMLA